MKGECSLLCFLKNLSKWAAFDQRHIIKELSKFTSNRLPAVLHYVFTKVIVYFTWLSIILIRKLSKLIVFLWEESKCKLEKVCDALMRWVWYILTACFNSLGTYQPLNYPQLSHGIMWFFCHFDCVELSVGQSWRWLLFWKRLLSPWQQK